MSGARAGKGFDWTEEAEARLRALWAQADPVLSTGLIGQMIGCGKNAVVGKAHRLRLPARPSPIRTLKNPDGSPVVRKPVPKRVAKAPGALVTLPSMARPVEALPLRSPLPEAEAPTVPVPPAPVAAQPPRNDGRGCCYPIGEPRAPGFRFCEAAVETVGRVYCDEHHALCWIKVRELRAPEVTNAKRANWGRHTLGSFARVGAE
jgi:GcrA cell cycle regulator